MIDDEVITLARAFAEALDPHESCGLVVEVSGRQSYWPCANLADDPVEDFILNPADWRKASRAGTIVAVIHSHATTPAAPSLADRLSCNVSGLPWLIIQARSGEVCHLSPEPGRPPLIGRPWVWGMADCWSLARDWYADHGLALPDFPRPATPQQFEVAPTFDQHWPTAGFVEALPGQAQPGDLLLMALRSTAGQLNHCAVLVEDGLILHHLRGRLSGREPYSQWWQRQTGRILRHADHRALRAISQPLRREQVPGDGAIAS